MLGRTIAAALALGIALPAVAQGIPKAQSPEEVGFVATRLKRLSDRIAIIDSGRVIACGTVRDLLSRLQESYRLSYHDPATGNGDLLLIIPFKTVARGYSVGCGRKLESFASHDHQCLIEVVHRAIADDGLAFAGHRDGALGLDPVNLRVAAGIVRGAAAFDLSVMGDQRIRPDRRGPARCDGIAAGDVKLLVLLPFDSGIGLHLKRKIVARGVQQLRDRVMVRERNDQQRQTDRRRNS